MNVKESTYLSESERAVTKSAATDVPWIFESKRPCRKKQMKYDFMGPPKKLLSTRIRQKSIPFYTATKRVDKLASF